MSELLNAYWPVILIALVIGLIVGFLIFRPRQRVRLTDSAPVRPHMAQGNDETLLGHEAEVTAMHVLAGDARIDPAGPVDDLERRQGGGAAVAAALSEDGPAPA